jgi:hypothetical protein
MRIVPAGRIAIPSWLTGIITELVACLNIYAPRPQPPRHSAIEEDQTILLHWKDYC